MSDAAERRELSQQRFGDFAQNYVTSNVHGSGYTLDRLIALLEPKAGQRALDIATGGGHVALALARAGAEVMASDLTPRMLNAARSHITQQGLDVSYGAVDAEHFPFADASLDIVTCRVAAHHFPNAAQFVRECARVVKRGGIVGLVDQIGPAEPEDARYINTFERVRDPSHNWQYSQPEWESFFTGVGLRVINSEIATMRFDLKWWSQMQNNDAETVLRLRVMLAQAPKRVAEWLQPDMPDMNNDATITFAHHDLIPVGVKEG